MARKQPQLLEKAEQENLVQWFRLKFPDEMLMAIPNGLARPHSAAQSVKGGLLKGAPDLFIAAARKGHYGFFLELKRPSVFGSKPGIASMEQKDVLMKLNRAGYLALLAYGWVEASKMIEEYLND